MVHIVSHTEVQQCSIDDMWEAGKYADVILPTFVPDYFTKSVFLEGHGEPGCIRIVKMGPVFPDVEEVSECMDFVDDANKTLGYTVLEGSLGYHYFNVGLNFSPKATAGTTDATWTASYVPMADMGPSEHVKDVYIKVLKAFVNASKAN